MLTNIKKLISNLDVRDYQILSLTCFLGLGVVTRDWTLKPNLIIVLIVSTLSSQIIGTWLVKAPKINWRSAIITVLGLILLLRGNSYLTMIVAGCCGIGSKFLLRYHQRHFFNPANFGIISALILTNDAWVSPGQWGTDWWYLALFICTGGLILQKVGRWDTSAIFLLTYSLLFISRNLWLGWTWDVLYHQLSSGSLLLFAFFMITDPRSIPNARISRIIWSIVLALVSFILQTICFIPTGVFWALFALSPVTIILDRLWAAPEFVWSNSLSSQVLDVKC